MKFFFAAFEKQFYLLSGNFFFQITEIFNAPSTLDEAEINNFFLLRLNVKHVYDLTFEIIARILHMKFRRKEVIIFRRSDLLKVVLVKEKTEASRKNCICYGSYWNMSE